MVAFPMGNAWYVLFVGFKSKNDFRLKEGINGLHHYPH